MHLILMTRGVNSEVEIWKKFMETQMWWWKRQPLLKDEKGNYIKDGVDDDGNQKYKRGPEELTRVAGALRPIQLWEYVIPEEGAGMIDGKLTPTSNFKELLASLNLHNENPLRNEMKPIAWALRKAMHLKPVPKFTELYGKKIQELTQRFIYSDGVAVYPIGIKQDKTQDFIFNKGKQCEEGWYQEGI